MQAEIAKDTIAKTVTSAELNYSNYALERSMYTFNSISQQTGQSGVTITTSGGNSAQFELPAGTFINLARSYISFYQVTPDPGATPKFTHTHIRGVPQIREISLVGKSTGSQIANVRYANRYVHAAILKNTKLTDAITRGCPQLSATSVQPLIAKEWIEDGLTFGYIASNSITERYDSTTRDIGGVNTATGEPAYILAGTDTEVQSTAFKISLATFFDTALALDKTIMLSESLYLKIIFESSIGIYFTSTSATDPAAGTAASAALSVSIDNLLLHMCVDDNLKVQEKIQSEVFGGGMALNCNVVESAVNTITGTSHSVQTRHSGGGVLKKVYFCPQNSTEAAATFYDLDCLGGRVVSFYVNLDNKRLNRANYVLANADDYLECARKYRGSCVTSISSWYYNWSFVLDLTNNDSVGEQSFIPKDNYNDGLSIDGGERRVDLVATTSGTVNWYTFSVYGRKLLITPKGLFMQSTA